MELQLVLKDLKAKEQELHFHERLLKKEEAENTELKTKVRAKEEEIVKLQDSLKEQDAKIRSIGHLTQGLREELQQVSTELAGKVSQVQELERSKKELKDERDRERKRVDQLLIQATIGGDMNAYNKEVEVSSFIMNDTLQSHYTLLLY